MATPQNYKNHTRFDPAFHFVLAPLLLLNLIASIWATVHNWPYHAHLFLWYIVMSIVLILLAGKARGYPIKVQDRIIRLEERIRYAALLPQAELMRSTQLTEAQIVGLRFASDAELPALIDRTLSQNLSQKQIKEAITNWRPDHFRV